ncbi:electron transfer flavoprotein subunit beta/FixA family protein [bacterium]|nr:electron transfer flavoprotein subunit beta/FixA family protein [bacterium]
MNILILLRMVPDVVEELEVAADGKSLDTSFLRTILNERDEHALEEALLLKEKYGGTVTAVALAADEIDDVLFTALAKGADRAAKVTGGEPAAGTRSAARLLAAVIPGLPPADLILTGVQAADDLDGQTGPVLAQRLGLPYLGIVTQVTADAAAKTATVLREFAGGVRGEFEVPLPAVLGIQSAEKPPRYVPVAKVRAAMKSQKIEDLAAPSPAAEPTVAIQKMAKPEVTGGAEILEGSPEEVAAKLCEVLAARGVL